MSMAVVQDSPEEEGAEQAAVPEPTFAQIVTRQAILRARQFGRMLWRPVVIFVRSVFWLEEDSMRDQMIMSNRADVDYLASRVAGSISGVNLLNERLTAHEDAIPRMRAVKEQFDNTKRAEKEARDRQVEDAARAEAERDQRLEMGILA